MGGESQEATYATYIYEPRFIQSYPPSSPRFECSSSRKCAIDLKRLETVYEKLTLSFNDKTIVRIPKYRILLCTSDKWIT